MNMLVTALMALAGADVAPPLKMTVVTVTKGFRHDSIPAAERVFMQLAPGAGPIVVEVARNDEDLTRLLAPDSLITTDIIVFANTTGEVPLPDRDAFVNWISRGGAFIGVHSAADTLHAFDPYLDMLGGEFDFHGEIVSASVFVEEATHPATARLAPVVNIREEYYRFKRFDPAAVRVLLALHADPDNGDPGFFPISWVRQYGSGKVFYTALGHTAEIWDSVWFQQHLAGAIFSMVPEERRPQRRRAVQP